MPAAASDLRELHTLHQRAKALRDRLRSGPKTVAARQAALATRQAAIESARKVLQDARVQLKKKEHTVQSLNARIDDRTVRLNTVKKNDEYKAIQNEIAMEKHQIDKIEGEMLEEMERIEDLSRALATEEADVKTFAAEVEALRQQVESQATGQRSQLAELETAIVEAEAIIPEDVRERYRRTVKQYGAEAMAPAEYEPKAQLASCSGCFVALTTQGLNELLNGIHITFCKTCGRILYLADEDRPNTRRNG
jgi:predicted  nucleic acid-binding Zn-ribbon protein